MYPGTCAYTDSCVCVCCLAVSTPYKPEPLERKAPTGLTDFDSRYLGTVLGDALILGLSEVAQTRPWDPIEYLAQWLYKHSDNVKLQQQVRAWVRACVSRAS